MNNGPVQDRSCTDVLFCLVFIIFLAGMAAVTGYGMLYGWILLLWQQVKKNNFLFFIIVGYGDFTPLTDFGKIFCIISCLFGIFLLSMLVAVITLMITLDDDETKVNFFLLFLFHGL